MFDDQNDTLKNEQHPMGEDDEHPEPNGLLGCYERLTLEPFDEGSVQPACKQRGATLPDEKCPICPDCGWNKCS
jgi:hypothetical protein